MYDNTFQNTSSDLLTMHDTYFCTHIFVCFVDASICVYNFGFFFFSDTTNENDMIIHMIKKIYKCIN